jgi:1-acyl-sn-glycerol-3-phosphate acyltransferase
MDPRIWFHVLLLRPFLRLLFGVHVKGAGQLDHLDQFVIVANHNSHLDTLLLMSVLPRRHLPNTRPVAAADHFGKSRALSHWMDRLLAPVWVDRVNAPGEAVHDMSQALEAGNSLILFPEGTRGEPGEMAPFHTGIGRLLETNPDVPVIPAHILGPERALPRGTSMPLPVWNRVLLGPAMRLFGTPRNVTETLRSTIEELARAEQSRRQQRILRRRDSFTVAALGIDGSGKSTLARNLAVELSASHSSALIGDELRLIDHGADRDIQPLPAETLRRRLSRQAKGARSLAAYKIPKLAELILRDVLQGESRRWYDPSWVIMDGSPLLNMTAWSILYKEQGFDPEFCGRALGVLSGRERVKGSDLIARRFPELHWLQRLGLNHLSMPDAAIFIDVDAAEAVSRIEARGDTRQVHETADKLARLRDAYIAVCEVAAERFDLPVLRLDGTRPREELASAAAEFARATRSGTRE